MTKKWNYQKESAFKILLLKLITTEGIARTRGRNTKTRAEIITNLEEEVKEARRKYVEI
jgi:hypothetical protein